MQRRPAVEIALETILADHFERFENPHETIHRIWLLLNEGTPPAYPDGGHSQSASAPIN